MQSAAADGEGAESSAICFAGGTATAPNQPADLPTDTHTSKGTANLTKTPQNMSQLAPSSQGLPTADRYG